ncbi:MAG: hypothetical protein OI860_00240 (plasmid) [Candidatus Methanoperedens sp.]|uniref:hypothetical protein n=1 Tax=Candidatus Methanoperedens sp. BLZ2 TaxID=2035255 RepID=UPI00114166F9|nr:hypothetical protein [Candidatus Methanoperedens sp. BLZ2]KAB2946441.1 MAG: hypothetical protein F9K14_07600 [Candidatus Methanoperedens sp.]MBZ0175677.1 hypothetical protein [Candidatus Methanoperedens nitroreducens]WAH95053.1 MAG: hypothetical protein OI863_00225 [Candidatus Methanoperedens sp.]WAM22225.1 MAG: hypothetical protein OI860_00240 [Candidatus Methanoperedens sp.]
MENDLLMKNLDKKISISNVIFNVVFVIVSIIIFYVLFKVSGINFSTYPDIFLNFAIKMNNYSNLILSILTFFLVIITAYYAKVTHKLLKLTDDNRRFEIKPNLLINVGEPEFSVDNKYRILSNKINITNYGRGPAVDIKFKTSVADDNETNAVCQHRDIPILLPTDPTYEVIVNIHTSQYNLHDYKEDFLRLDVLYEDVERNLYKLKHVYRLVIIQENPVYFVMKSEELYFCAFEDRTSIFEGNFLNRKDKLIFSRQGW